MWLHMSGIQRLYLKTSPLDVSNVNKVMSFEEFIPYEKKKKEV